MADTSSNRNKWDNKPNRVRSRTLLPAALDTSATRMGRQQQNRKNWYTFPSRHHHHHPARGGMLSLVPSRVNPSIEPLQCTANNPPRTASQTHTNRHLAAHGEPPAKARPWGAWLCVTLVIGLALGPVVVRGLPEEVASWYEARAIEQDLEGDQPAAEATLARALEWYPDSPTALLRRAQWNMEAGDYAASLRDCEQILENSSADVGAQLTRAEVLQHLGRHAEAIEIWERLAKPHRDGTGITSLNLLNGWAYARALGQADLDAALRDSSRGADRLERDASPAATRLCLDTRGFIQLLRGELAVAAQDLDLAVELAEAGLRRDEQARDYHDPRQFQRDLQRTRQSVAVICYHRALLNDRRGQPADAARDRRRVKQLGFEPNDQLF